MAKYETPTGVQCTPEEEKLIDALKRLAKKRKQDGQDLTLFSWSGDLCVMKNYDLEETKASDSVVAWITGIRNDGGCPN